MLGGEGGPLAVHRLVCHCLLIEGADGLVLIDTGFGLDDVRRPRQLGLVFSTLVRPRLNASETAISQIRELGLDPHDVRNIITTHLDLDHAGGLPDFPDADVHLLGRELDAALKPSWRDKPRYDIPGSLWLPDTGYGELSAPMLGYFLSGLRDATQGDASRTLVFYCQRDCWMSWNAAKRALASGFAKVDWYPDGANGWAEAGYPLEERTPSPRPQ